MSNLACPLSPDVLTAGAWTPRRGILVWVADNRPPRWETVHDLIACPACRARVDEPCRSRRGKPRAEPHVARLVSQRCPCGGLLGRKQQRCESCTAAWVKAAKYVAMQARRKAA